MTVLYYYDLDGFVNDHSKPLHLVRRIEQFTHDDRGVTLRAGTNQVHRRFRDRYGTLAETADMGEAGDPVAIRVEFCTPEIFRFRMAATAADVPPNSTPMVIEDFAEESFEVEFSADDAALTLETTALKVVLHRFPWRIQVFDRAGTELYSTIPAAIFQHPPTGMNSIDSMEFADAYPWFFRHVYPLGFVKDPQTGLMQTFDTAELYYDEHFYGFGEKFSDLDKRGQSINLWQANATGNTRLASYKNVPFFMSSRGYGMFMNTSYPIQHHLGDMIHTRHSFHVQSGLLDYYFIYGPTLKEILPRYTHITGKPGLPPLWSFGLWMSRMSYREQMQVETVAEQMRAHDIPCDVIHIDTDWFKDPWVNDLEFSEERFPDPSAMIARLREQGFRLTLWQIPYIGTDSKFFAEGAEKGYFARKPDGTPRLIAGFFGQAAVIDYSNPETVAWYTGHMKRLFDMGVAAIKTDFGEGAPIDAEYATVDGLAMHNLYPLLYNDAIFNFTKAQTGEGIVWGRSAWAGSQRYPVQWGGDPAVLWGDLATLWHGGLGFGLSGFPFWSVDIGGFGGTPTPEQYIRWAQPGLFVSHPRAHGPIAREPWVFGEQALAIFQKYAKLRYRLMPYVWSMAHESVETSLPMLRALVLDWQDDPTVYTIDDQWLFGESLMIAPIFDLSNRRRVYFPAGRWVDFWTDEIIEGGGWQTVEAPLAVMPLYVRGGAIIPYAPDMDYTEQKPWTPLTIDIYPHGNSSFTLFDRDNTPTLIRCEQVDGVVNITIDGSDREYHLRVHHLPIVTQISLDQSPLSDGWTVEAGVCHIRFAGRKQEVRIE